MISLNKTIILLFIVLVTSVAGEFNVAQIQQNAAEYFATLPLTVQEDANLTTPQLITKYGYPCEIHTITTSDGYILELHRIPHPPGAENIPRPVVILFHGLTASSADWVLIGPGKALPYLLVESGYDVWMPNARGNRYSRKHIYLNPDYPLFWNFSWHEIGVFDLTAVIDYALQITGQTEVFYIGHSQGTTIYYVMCTEKPEYNSKIRLHISLAPSAYESHMTSPILRLAALLAQPIVPEVVGMNDFLPYSEWTAIAGSTLCKDEDVTQILCTNMFFLLFGFTPKQMNTTLLPVMMGHAGTGSSGKQFLHYGQEITSGKFRQYDYGELNFFHYDTWEPPKYIVSKIESPVILFYSLHDWISNEVDVNKFASELVNFKQKILVPYNFSHVDYLYGLDAPKLYNTIIEQMASY